MKKFAVFDIDGTLFRSQLYHEVVFELIESGCIPKHAKKEIDEKMTEWRNRAHHHAFHDYEMAVVHAFRPHLSDIKMSDVEAAADKILARSSAQVYTYSRDLIETLRNKGFILVAISGSHDEIVKRFAKLWKFDLAFGQIHDKQGDHYTGTIPGGKLLVEQKGQFLKNIVKEYNLTWQDSVGIGDSLSDAAMLALVQYPIAFNPNDELFNIAKKHHWRVVIERKNMIYELEPHGNSFVLA
jgi:HAD superfamily hydrolase (TIGR01490 family)